MPRLVQIGALAAAMAFSVGSGVAQAVVVNDGTTTAGVGLIPGTRSSLAGAGVTTNTAVGCSDPWLAPDLRLPASGALCWRGGNVLHSNETFALTWDPQRRYWGSTGGYIQQFLRDVGDGSGTLSSPYAVTDQYQDASGRVSNRSAYGGGCIDFGAVVRGFTCHYPGAQPATGNDYPAANSCTPTGVTPDYVFIDGSIRDFHDDRCITDADIRQELQNSSQQVLSGHVQAGYDPVIVVLTPPGVEVCLDSAGKLCSATSQAPARFCSYHAQYNGLSYVVVPWSLNTACDEPDAPKIPATPSPQELATDLGVRLVSSLSQAHLAALTDPALNGWVAPDGSEINDNGCVPLGNGLDNVTVGRGSYLLQREFNNAGAIESDPNALGCTPNVVLNPSFVVPSAVSPGDLVQLDGSPSASTLIVPGADYFWSFGDGTTAMGPSVVHSYAAGGNYTIKLSLVDRGGNFATTSQTITVLGPTGSVGPPPTKKQPPTSFGLHARLQLIPQGLGGVLRHGLSFWVTSDLPASAIVTLSVPRSSARKAHLHTGRAASVVIGRGTVRTIRDGRSKLQLRLSRATARQLSRLRHVTVTVKLVLVGAGHARATIDVAGRY